MVSKFKKIIYSSFTIPIACLTFTAFRWQWRRMDEKIVEMSQRTELLNKSPIDLNENENFKNKDLLEFTPIKLNCKIENLKDYFKVINTNDSSPGFRLIYCVKINKIDKNERIIVDFGWVPEDFDVENNLFDLNNMKENNIIIKGVIYKGDKNPIKNQYNDDSTKDKSNTNDKLNISKSKNFIYFDLQTFSNLYEKELKYDNVITSYCIKRVNLEDEVNCNVNLSQFKSVFYPKLKSKRDLLYWYVTPEVHRSYYIFWSLATFFNILSNVYVWCYL